MIIEKQNRVRLTIPEETLKKIVCEWAAKNTKTYLRELPKDEVIEPKDVRIGCQIQDDYTPHNFIIQITKEY